MSTRLARPGISRANPWRFPEPARSDLDNRARLWRYDLPGQQIVSVQIVLDAPVSAEPARIEGVATIVAWTSDEGSRAHPGAALAELIEDQGATYSGTTNSAGSVLRLEVPASRLATALPVLAEICTQPAFEPADVERQVALRLAEIEQAMVRSSQLAALGLQHAVFAGRPGRPVGGRASTVSAITCEDVATFHDRWWRPRDATIVLAGALPTDAEELVAAAFAGWTGGTESGHQPAVFNTGAPRTWVIDRPGAVQADIHIGTGSPDRRDQRWAALAVASCAIGGSFGSRLNKVLREELGYTYGAHADFRPGRGTAMFSVRTSCRTEVAARATVAALELLDLANAPLTQIEVTDARNYLLGVAPLQFQTADVIADQASALAAAGIAPEWINEHHTRVAATTPDEATAAFSEVVSPDQLHTVLCGDASRLLPDLAAAGLAAELWDPGTLA